MIENPDIDVNLTGKELAVYRIHSTGNLCTLNISAQLCDEVDVIATVNVNGQLYGISGKELAGIARKMVAQQQMTGGLKNGTAATAQH